MILGVLHFHMNFRISLSISPKKASWDFGRDCIKYISLKSIVILKILSLQIHEGEIFSHSLRSSLISSNNLL